MKICTRFSDKITYIILIIGVMICFVVCTAIYSYEFYVTQDFWKDSVECLAERNFECLLEVRADQSINKDLLLTLIGANLSITGVIFGFLIVTLYTGFRRRYIRSEDFKENVPFTYEAIIDDQPVKIETTILEGQSCKIMEGGKVQCEFKIIK